MDSNATARGRPRLVGSDVVVATARAMLSEHNAAAFSVRRLAETLSVAPGTIYARFGTKQELLAQAYIERLVELDGELRSRVSRGGLATVLGKLSGPLTQLRTDFAVRFEFEGAPARGVRPETWQAMRIAFRQLIATVYALVAAAAGRDGVDLVFGPFAERIVWSALATGASERNADVFGHSNASYFRFLAGALSAALAAQ